MEHGRAPYAFPEPYVFLAVLGVILIKITMTSIITGFPATPKTPQQILSVYRVYCDNFGRTDIAARGVEHRLPFNLGACCNCYHLRTGCIAIAVIIITFWTSIILFLLLDDGVGIPDAHTVSWATRANIIFTLAAASARILLSVILIIGAAKKQVVLLAIFLVAWTLNFAFILAELIFSIVVSNFDAVISLYHVVYSLVRIVFGVLAIVIVSNYRKELLDEIDEQTRTDNKRSIAASSLQLER